MADKELVTVEDGVLMAMAGSDQYVAEFPFLANLKAKAARSGCRPCQRSNQNVSTSFRSAKTAIAALPAEKKRRLKEILRARKLRVVYVNTSGKVVQLTF